MKARELKILFLCEGANFAGAESYLLHLIEGIKNFAEVKITCALFHDGPLKSKLVGRGIETTNLFGKSNWKSVIGIIKYARKNNIDLIHFIDAKSTIVGGVAASFLRRVRTVSTIHGLPESTSSLLKGIKYRTWVLLYYLCQRYVVTGTICVSADLKSRQPKALKKKNTRVIYNGVSIPPAHLLNNESVSPQGRAPVTIGTVGRLDEVKGHSIMLEAARRVLKARPDVFFDIVGSGPLESSLRLQAQRMGIADRVRFLGFREDAHELIRRMDIFILSSLHEGVPYVLLEAMSYRKPVVCTRVGGIEEIVSHGRDGLLVPPSDPEKLSEALLLLLNDNRLAEALGRNARRKVESSFSSAHMASATYNFYCSLRAMS